MSSHSSTNHTNHHHAQRQRNETHSTRNDIRMVGKSLKYKKETCRYHLLTGYLKTTKMNAKIIKSHFSATRFITYLTTDKSISSQTTHTKNAARRTTKLSPFSLKQKKKSRKGPRRTHMKKVNSITYSVELGLSLLRLYSRGKKYGDGPAAAHCKCKDFLLDLIYDCQ